MNEEPRGLYTYQTFVTNVHFQEISSPYSSIQAIKTSTERRLNGIYAMAFLNKRGNNKLKKKAIAGSHPFYKVMWLLES